MLLDRMSRGEGLPSCNLPGYLVWGRRMNCAALDGCQVSGMVLRLSSQEHLIRGLGE